jgi:tetratricopeptide (TPR) repeat protein
VVVGDHGEAMGEHDEQTHMYFVYEGTIHVPLLLWGAGVPAGLKIQSLVRTVDVAPTILALLDLPPLEAVQGVSLLPLIRGDSLDLDLVGYGESIETLNLFGTSVLRFVREGPWKYIHKVEPELFDLEHDPRELENLASAHPEIVERLRSELSTLIEEAPEPISGARKAIDPETAAQLEALGYLATAPSRPLGDERKLLEVSGVDPTALTRDIDLVSTGAGRQLAHQYAESAELYREVLRRHPDNVAVLMRLSGVLSELGEDDERFEILNKVIGLDPEMASAYSDLAQIVFKRGDPAQAERLLATSLRIAPCTAGPRATLAYLAAQRNDHAREIQLLKEGVDQCPPDHGLLNNYAYALATTPDPAQRNGEEALRFAKQINQGEPQERPDYLDTLACAYAEVGDFANAVRVGERILALRDPAGDPRLAEEWQAHLEQFRAGRPVRAP